MTSKETIWFFTGIVFFALVLILTKYVLQIAVTDDVLVVAAVAGILGVLGTALLNTHRSQ